MYKVVRIILLISFLALPGCNFTSCSSKPLKDIEKYQVTLFVSPYGDLNTEKAKKLLQEKLSSLGQVVETNAPISEETPMLFISLEPKGAAIPSSIRVLGRVKILDNGCELSSVIWSHPLRAEGIFIPVEQDGKVSFVQEGVPLASQSDLLDSLLKVFAEEYRAANPKHTPITFLISQ